MESAVPVSDFLATFLRQKRVHEEIPPPPEEEARSDQFLRVFFDNYQRKDVAADSDGGDVSDGDQEDSDEATGNRLRAMPPTKVVSDKIFTGESLQVQPELEPEPELENPQPTSLKLGNLPFKLSLRDLSSALTAKKVNFIDVTLDYIKESGLPAGSALLKLAATQDVADCNEKLKSLELMGRKVYVMSLNCGKHLKGGIKDVRYFIAGDGDITKKCSKCGNVGHNMRDCNNEPLPLPCHLCAGIDHDAAECKNITCFRCGAFGHHVKLKLTPSKDCKGHRTVMPNNTVSLCSICGSTRHTANRCAAGNAIEDGGHDGKHIKCMSCNEFGHAMCKQLPSVKRGLFCPNCGKSDHHIDFLGEGAACSAPRQDAYVRFPQLLFDLDRLPASDRERNSYYSSLTSNAAQASHLFPSLARNTYPGVGSDMEYESSASTNHKKSRHSMGGQQQVEDYGGYGGYVDYGGGRRQRHSTGEMQFKGGGGYRNDNYNSRAGGRGGYAHAHNGYGNGQGGSHVHFDERRHGDNRKQGSQVGHGRKVVFR